MASILDGLIVGRRPERTVDGSLGSAPEMFLMTSSLGF